MATLNVRNKILAYIDPQTSNNPKRRAVDWDQNFYGVVSSNPTNNSYEIARYDTVTVFDGTRSISNDNTTELNLDVTTLDPSTYRLKWTNNGTAPLFRTTRALSLTGGNIIVTLNSNQTVTISSSLGAVFGTVQVGDVVEVPGVSTGDTTSIFDPLNEGFWTVLSASTSSLVLSRDDVFSGATQTVAITTNQQFKAYSVSGVQVGDTIDLSGSNFSQGSKKLFTVTAVTDISVDFVSTLPLPTETKVSPAIGVKLYKNSKFLVYIESDQEIAVYLNGSTTDYDIIEPILQGADGLIGFFSKTGATFSLSIKNRSNSPANVFVITAER